MKLKVVLDSIHGRPFSGVQCRACVNHMLSCGERKCSASVWMKRMSSLALRECCSYAFFSFCISVLCFVSIVLWFTHFLQSYVLLCNWLFSRQTFLSEECSVLWNSSVALQSVKPLALVFVAIYILFFFWWSFSGQHLYFPILEFLAWLVSFVWALCWLQCL